MQSQTATTLEPNETKLRLKLNHTQLRSYCIKLIWSIVSKLKRRLTKMRRSMLCGWMGGWMGGRRQLEKYLRRNCKCATFGIVGGAFGYCEELELIQCVCVCVCCRVPRAGTLFDEENNNMIQFIRALK